MQSFISETIDDILKKNQNFQDVVFVLPSQRAKVFLKADLIQKMKPGFLPELFNIEEFIEHISGMFKTESIDLLFQFYTIYKKIEENPDDFDVFSSWAFTVLQDFNEIDQHLIDTNDIFIYIRDIQRLRKWSVKGSFQETALIKDHHKFLEKLNAYYPVLYKKLLEDKTGYQGMLYRESCKKVDDFLDNNTDKTYYFLGFNALNKAEEFLIQQFLNRGNSDIYWDIDHVFLNTNHQAGKFIRQYKKTWKYYEKETLKIVGKQFSETKNITITGAAKNVTQIKYAGELLSKITSFNKTALVLADESLLPVMINSLPENINGVNITMGYPLKDVPTTHFINTIFQLFLTQQKLQKTATNEFYHKDIVNFVREPLLYHILSHEERASVLKFTEKIAQENLTFVSKEHLHELSNYLTPENNKIVTKIFNPFTTIDDFIDRIIATFLVLKDHVSVLEKEYLFRYYTAFMQLKNLQEEYHYFTDLKNLSTFFKQLIASESLSFQGEPLQGLQLMGMLETRMLDFENVILIGANEGILPANVNQSTFIPFDVKVNFGLPTYREKDAIFSYHFFRLLQRAKNVHILYNTEPDVYGSGEKSRFIKQLELMQHEIVENTVSPNIVSDKIPLKIIEKEEIIMQSLEELAKKGISPSALTNYLYNPIAFYKQKILKISELDDVEETVAYNTLGNVIHDTLDELYKPYINSFLKTKHILLMNKISDKLVKKYFTKYFKNGDITTGKNRLIFEVAKRFIDNFLAKEKELVADVSNQLKIIATEETLATQLHIEGLAFPVKIHGQVDRVDELNGTLRIVDYKTGKVDTGNLRITDFEKLRDEKHHKAIQVLLYAYLYISNNPKALELPMEAGIYSFKNLNKGFLPVNFSSNYRQPDLAITQEKIDAFLEELKIYILEIYNKEIPFEEPVDLKY
ncbi:PD-(D/E)XK nuclease family protein [Polaribacter sp.]|nr:PD-(D/E)XK nuclease family protein [Polaribacter sp.]